MKPSLFDRTDNRPNRRFRWRWLAAGLVIAIGGLLLLLLHPPVFTALGALYDLLTDRQRITDFIKGFGVAAPLVFMALQFIQVLLAPIPGEVTGFIGGYLFGAFYGTVLSTLALTLGSAINFLVGRILGKKWVRKMIPPVRFAKMDYLLRHQGILLIFFLFLIPGFPKDYLCLFLGVSTIPLRVFLLLTIIGRLPGTLMLNLQGALVFDKNYILLSSLMAFNLIILIVGFCNRNRLYRWIDKFSGHSREKIDARIK